jgi:hypothetical protein
MNDLRGTADDCRLRFRNSAYKTYLHSRGCGQVLRAKEASLILGEIQLQLELSKGG